MRTVVVDASALAFALMMDTDNARVLRLRLIEDTCHAPHLIDAELGNLLRRHLLRDEMSPKLGRAVLTYGPRYVDHRHKHAGALASAAWRLRERVTFYDALYVALAADLDVPLLTADKRLAGAGNLPCEVEVVSEA